MNLSRFLFAFFFISSFLALSAFAQVPTASSKIAFINTEGFYDEKEGIVKLVNVNKQLEQEFSARFKELQDSNTKLQAIAKELETMQKLPQAQFNQSAFASKQEEGERLQRTMNYKKTDYESMFNKRRTELMTPVSQDIGKAIDEFAKKNGYDVIIDISKFAGAVLYFSDVADTTKKFIAFYNTRPTTLK
jgi:outer membrane protein